MSASFAHLHLHTEFSMLDGAARVEEVVKRAAVRRPAGHSHNRPRQHVRRPGFLQGRPRGRGEAHHRDRGLHGGREPPGAPLRRGRMDDTGGEVEEGDKLYYHLTLLAENDRGYKNLLKLSSEAYLSGYWYKPRADWELLERYHEGVIATTGCLGGLVNQALLRGDFELATAHAVAAAGDIRARQPLRRTAGPRAGKAAQDKPATGGNSPAHRGSAAGDQRQPLHHP